MCSCGVTVGLSLPVPCMELTTSRIACTSSLLSGAHISLARAFTQLLRNRAASVRVKRLTNSCCFARSMTTTMIKCAVCLHGHLNPAILSPFWSLLQLEKHWEGSSQPGYFQVLICSCQITYKTFTLHLAQLRNVDTSPWRAFRNFITLLQVMPQHSDRSNIWFNVFWKPESTWA